MHRPRHGISNKSSCIVQCKYNNIYSPHSIFRYVCPLYFVFHARNYVHFHWFALFCFIASYTFYSYSTQLHAPARLGNYHFGAEFMELVPEFFQLEMTLDLIKMAARRTPRDDVTVGTQWLADVRSGVCWRHNSSVVIRFIIHRVCCSNCLDIVVRKLDKLRSH